MVRVFLLGVGIKFNWDRGREGKKKKRLGNWDGVLWFVEWNV